MTVQTPVTTPTGTPHRRAGAILALLACAQGIIALDYNIVFVALPEIGRSLGFGQQDLQWVVSAYAVAFGGFLLLGGRAADLFGRRRMFVLGLALYAVSSLVGGLAGSPLVLVLARAVQGLGGAFLAPATLSLVTTSFAEGRERNRAISIWGAAGSSGMVAGSLLGGVLTDALGWPSVFYVNVLLAGVGIAAAFALLPHDPARTGPAQGFDLPGALTATIGSTALVLALVQAPKVGWTSVWTIGTVAAAVAILALFVQIQRRSAAPLLPLGLFRNRNVSVGASITFLFMASFGAIAYFLTLYFQDVLGYSPMATGLAFVMPCVFVLLGTIVGGRLATRSGVRGALGVGFAMGLVGTAILALTIAADGSYLVSAAPLAFLSLGQGIVFTAMYAAATSGVDAHDQGIASGVATAGQQVGGAVGLAVLVAVAGAVTGDSAGVDGIRVATVAIAVGTGFGIVLTGLLRPRSA
jgi:EmrB/QacA subfamily drug resistance transporter